MNQVMARINPANWKIFPAVILSFVILGQMPSAYALNAGDDVTTNVVLDRDLVVDGKQFGLRVKANNITIDGNGYALIVKVKSSKSPYSGILVGDYPNKYHNITIKNFREISGFRYGINLTGSTGVVVDNCRIESNMESGIYAYGSSDLTIRNSILKEMNTCIDFSRIPGLTLSGNTFWGGKKQTFLSDAEAATNNRILHPRGYRPQYFRSAKQKASVGETVEFSIDLSVLARVESNTVSCTVRTVPSEKVVYSRSGDLVSGSFRPTRNGLYSVVSETADSLGNTSLRIAKIHVGPEATHNLTYYPHGGDESPLIGPGNPISRDIAGMNFVKPKKPNTFYCGSWVDWYADALPNTPTAAISRIQFKLLFSGTFPWYSDRLSVKYKGNNRLQRKRLDIPAAYMTGKIEWGEFELNNMGWVLDYPQDWASLVLTYSSISPIVYTGDPTHWGHPAEHLSHVILDYTTTVSPEVRTVSNPDLLLYAATSDPESAGGTQLTVWGQKDEAELVVADFRMPFTGILSKINAKGETIFNSGMVDGEKTFTAVPLEISPAANAVNVLVGTWNTTGEQRREWTEAAVGATDEVAHTLSGLSPEADYRVMVGGHELLTGRPDAFGKLSFVYNGSFPATFAVSMVLPNLSPVITSISAVPGSVRAGDPVSISVSASDPDSGPQALSYIWSKTTGSGAVNFSSSHAVSGTASFSVEGNYTLQVVVSDGADSVSGLVNITVTRANQPPVAAFTATPGTGAAPHKVQFDASSSSDDIGISSYSWTFGDGSNATGVNPTHTFTTPGDYTVTLTVTDGSNLSNSTTRSIQALQNPPIIDSNPTASPNPAEVGQSVAFQVSATDADNDKLTYTWTFGDGTTGSGANPSHTYNTAGTHTVSVLVTDGNGGSANATINVVVNDSLAPELEITSVVLKGKVNDASGVASLKVNGQAVTVQANGSWQQEVSVGVASTVVAIEVIDDMGNITVRTVTVQK